MQKMDLGNLKLLIKALDSSHETMLVVDNNKKIVFANKILCEKINANRNDLIGMDLEKYKELIKDRFVYVEGVLETGKPSVDSLQLTEEIALEVVAYPVFDKNGSIIGAIGCGIDESLAEKLGNAIKEAEKKNESAHRTLSYMVEKSDGDGIIYSDKKMKRLFDSAALIAATDSTVLVTGESGTGKEIVANYIHKNSNRKDNVFMPVNCGAIPENLLEAEFFGYEKGAFTGADKNGKAGLFEIADKGTLFLDEIGELPLSMQAKLLRVLETGELKRIGGTKRIFTDVRIVAATNRNLEEMVGNKTFREDLYYRLSVIPLVIPPLRERPDDIELFMKFFVGRLNKKYKTDYVLDEETIEKYKNYSWPGNVRELKNEVERLVIYSMGNGGYFAVKPSEEKKALNSESCKEESRIDTDVRSGMKLKELVEKYEKEILSAALEKNDGNVKKTAEEFGIDRSSLYRKLK